jgi:hypothetical protein
LLSPEGTGGEEVGEEEGGGREEGGGGEEGEGRREGGARVIDERFVSVDPNVGCARRTGGYR